MWGRVRKLLPLALVAVLVVPLVADAGQRNASARARAAALPNLGAHQVPCPPNAKTCCPGADCNAHPELLPASPYLVQTAVGVESISPHEIHVGQRFTITFHRIAPSAANWYFPDIAKKVSRCKTGVDLTCTYVAQANDVTYPAAATYNGWSEFKWGGGDINGIGYGYDYYAIIGNAIPITGRAEDKHGHGIAHGGIPPSSPNGSTPDPGVLVVFTPVKHGVAGGYAAAPSIHGSRAHPYDVGYYGIALKRGTYTVQAGDPVRGIRCKGRRLHLTHAISNLNFVCNHG
jgi:hypothetical protein